MEWEVLAANQSGEFSQVRSAAELETDLNALGLLWGVLSEGTCESLHQSFIGCEKFSGSAGIFEGKWLQLRASLWKRGCRHLATTMHGSVLVGVGSWELAL